MLIEWNMIIFNIGLVSRWCFFLLLKWLFLLPVFALDLYYFKRETQILKSHIILIFSFLKQYFVWQLLKMFNYERRSVIDIQTSINYISFLVFILYGLRKIRHKPYTISSVSQTKVSLITIVLTINLLPKALFFMVYY